jgi:hypothetical protein
MRKGFSIKRRTFLVRAPLVAAVVAVCIMAGVSFKFFSIPPQTLSASIIGCWLGDCSVDVGNYRPECTMQVSPAVANPGSPITLSWSSNMLSPYITPDVEEAVASGSVQITASQSTTFTLYDHAGAHGWLRYWLYVLLGIPTPAPYCSAVFTASPSPNAPTCELFAFPTSVVAGDASALYYSIWGDFSSASIQGVGSAPLPPIIYTVYPSQDKLYELWVSYAGGTVKCYAPVQVQPAPTTPTLYIEASPVRVGKGKPAIVAWSGKNVSSCTLRNSQGQTLSTARQNPIPAPTFSINQTTTFTLTCTPSSGAPISKSVTVNLTPSVTEI